MAISTNSSSSKSHKKAIRSKLTTPFGDFLERTSYAKIARTIILVILGCTIYFRILTPFGHGTRAWEISWPDSFYFSVITFSSLGYGDIAPLGFGKIVASFEVLFGLVSIAILVGKLASERQSSLLLLLYTGEQQRRISDFSKEVYTIDNDINQAMDNHEHKKINSYGRQLYSFVSSIHYYLNFQATEGKVADFGNNTALRRLYQALVQVQTTSYEIIRTAHIEQQTLKEFERIIRRINGISNVMLPLHSQDTKAVGSLNEIRNITIKAEKWKESNALGTAGFKSRSGVTNTLLERVRELLPQDEWEKGIHKKVAAQLNIPIKLAQRCIDELLDQGYFPKT